MQLLLSKTQLSPRRISVRMGPMSTTDDKAPAEVIPFNKMDVDEQVELIHHALEAEVMPLLRSHGGGLEILDIDDYNVIVKYYGTCHGCPLSSTGTLDFIQFTLQSEIDENIRVTPSDFTNPY